MIGTRVKVVEGKGRTFPLTSVSHLCRIHCPPETVLNTLVCRNLQLCLHCFQKHNSLFLFVIFLTLLFKESKISHHLRCRQMLFYVAIFLLHFVFPLNGLISTSVLQ